MLNNPVIEAIYAAFKLEIANQFVLNHDTLELTLPGQSRLIIAAHKVNPATNNSHQATLTNTHTYHYTQTDQRLLLHNIEECRAYLDDVCHNLLDVPVHDFEITFPDGTVYLITIEPVE